MNVVAHNIASSIEPEIVIKPGMILAEIEKLAILATLKAQRHNPTKSAKVLGIGIRTLQRKLKQYQAEGLLAHDA